MNQSRQLAAIMPVLRNFCVGGPALLLPIKSGEGGFTDIVGYTQLMGENESQTLQLIRKNRNLHKSIINNHDSI